MKFVTGLLAITLVGCASTDSERYISRDRTMESMAKTALIAEMLNSTDPLVRAKGADIADKFLNEKHKKSLFDF